MLIIDEKEARSNSIARRGLMAALGDQCCVDSLISGDFASLDTPLTLGIEHKSISDLVHSLSSNRLDEQLSRLLDTYDVPVLLVDELPAPNHSGKITIFGSRHQVSYAWVMGSIMGWALRGITPVLVRTPGAIAPTIAAIYSVIAKPEHREHYEPRRLLENLRPLTLTERLLVQLPGIGPDRAAKMASLSPGMLGELDLAAWQKYVGPLTGKRAYEAWHGGR